MPLISFGYTKAYVKLLALKLVIGWFKTERGFYLQPVFSSQDRGFNVYFQAAGPFSALYNGLFNEINAYNPPEQTITRQRSVRCFSELIPIYHFLTGSSDPNKNFKQITVNVALSTLPGGLKLVNPV